MTERELAKAALQRHDAEDLIPMLGLDQTDPGYIVYDAFRPGRTAKPKGMRTSPHYRSAL